MKTTEIEYRVRQLNWPAPPVELRDSVLSAASLVGQPITWSDRVWFSRAWRLSAAATVVMIVGFELQSSSTRTAQPAPIPQAVADARLVEEIGRQAGLPPDMAASLAGRMLAAAASPRATTQEQTALRASALDGGGR
jgi:ABC-type amino acid transport substrate-binding protein